MKSRLFTVLLLLFTSITVFGITSNDAINQVVNSNNYLYDAETFTPPNVTLEFEGQEYWVIPLTAGNTITTYFAVEADSGLLSTSRAVNRGLFEVADNLNDLQSLKESISANPGVDWIFTQTYQTIFNEMSVQLNDEIFQLNTVETTLASEGMNTNLTSLKNDVGLMSTRASDLSEKIAEASNAESAFVTKPSPENFSDLEDSFAGVFDSIKNLNGMSLGYKSGIDKLKQQISVAALDAQTKSQLFGILEIPSGLQALRNYNLDSTQIKESFTAALKASDLARDSKLDELDNRIEKNDSDNLIWDDNEKIQGASPFNSLSEAQSVILDENNKPFWNNQSRVISLEQNYSRAIKFYNERNFEQSKEFSEKAISDVLAIIKSGEKEPLPVPQLFSQDLLFQIAGILIVILIILYIVNNRGKLRGMIDGKEETLDVYE
ncbi:hypothetical protein IIC68_00970 [archaeon]|nr:hypothetical protein [archaeon]